MPGDADEAVPHLLQPGEREGRGASVVMRDGVAVARLVPSDVTADASSAIAAVRAARSGVTLGGDLRAMRDEGRH